jgi:anti-sigma B factor antagonist
MLERVADAESGCGGEFATSFRGCGYGRHSPMAQLDLSIEQRQGGALVRLVGELDLSQAEALSEELARAEATEPATLVIDLRGVSFMDSTGLRLLLAALRRAEPAGRRLVLVRGQEQVRDLFRVARLDDVFELVDDPDEAFR